ncbi:hypothetical protein AWB69_08005 [Caballeronia udeis]|uniref:Uncharacterized protein n=1 Tax=Caballeronia udeis TaxID=1232866 RepID=A0A158JIR5_9BURK|nr:hypothetical protein AWB69_08005 [Caballeronia udeis]
MSHFLLGKHRAVFNDHTHPNRMEPKERRIAHAPTGGASPTKSTVVLNESEETTVTEPSSGQPLVARWTNVDGLGLRCRWYKE